MSLLDIRDLRVSYAGRLEIVKGASLAVEKGRTTCLVGESGSGKSMIANAVMDLLPSSQLKVSGGDIRYDGRSLVGLPAAQMRGLRGRAACPVVSIWSPSVMPFRSRFADLPSGFIVSARRPCSGAFDLARRGYRLQSISF